MGKSLEIQWIIAGIIGGISASIFYPALIFINLPLGLTATAAALLGPAIGVGSLGLRQILVIQKPSMLANIAAIWNLIAGLLFSAMGLIQLAVRELSDISLRGQPLQGVWLGLDVAWDIYIGLGTICFAAAMISHKRFGWPFSVSGLLIGLLVIGLNLIPFPIPPAEAGLFDIGPLVGIWYLAATIQTWRSLKWAEEAIR